MLPVKSGNYRKSSRTDHIILMCYDILPTSSKSNIWKSLTNLIFWTWYLWQSKSWKCNEISQFITWQGSLEVNLSDLIGSFLVGISFRKPSNSKFATKTTKRKRVNVLLFTNKPPKGLIFYEAYNMDEAEYSPSETFFYPEDLETM